MIPCPTVHRFVVAQYRTSPAGKRMMKVMKTSGSPIIRYRCPLFIAADMKNVEAIWLPA
jgi:hypothetical protein